MGLEEKPASELQPAGHGYSTSSQETPDEAGSPAPEIDPVPNGGATAWLQVLGSFFLFFNTWGFVNSFGQFQAYYETVLHNSPSDISWIGTVQGFILLLVGIITGPIYDLGYFRALIMSGTFLLVFGMMMLSIADQYYQIFLAQAIVAGLGAGCLFVPSVGIVTQYFTTKRAFATGIAAAGGSIGGAIYPIVFHELQPIVGFGWATRVIAFISLGTLLVSLAIAKPRVITLQKRALFDPSAFRDVRFILCCLGLFLSFVGIYFPFYYVSSWATTKLDVNPRLAFYMFSVLNFASVFGRVLPGLVADRLGSLNIMIPFLLLTAILGFAWNSVENLAGLIVICIFYGFFSGACVSLPPTIVAGICTTPSRVGTWMGMCFSFAGLGLLIGNPIAGSILDSRGGGFDGAQYFSAAAIMGGALSMCAMRWLARQPAKAA